MKCTHDCHQTLIKRRWSSAYSIYILVSWSFGYIGVCGRKMSKNAYFSCSSSFYEYDNSKVMSMSLKNRSCLGKDFLGANFLAAKSCHWHEKQPISGPTLHNHRKNVRSATSMETEMFHILALQEVIKKSQIFCEIVSFVIWCSVLKSSCYVKVLL